MPALRPDTDPDGLLEYSVVYTDRALNHMSQSFQGVMTNISSILKEAYNADITAVVPGGGTYAMEAVARQFTRGQRCLIIRNGWFSYRWTQILETANLPSDTRILKASRTGKDNTEPFSPPPIEDVCDAIRKYKPDVIFAPHVETSAGLILPDDYLQLISAAAKEVDALFVLDCIASGTIWVDMSALGIDVVISAPQKGWSGPACAGMVAMGPRATERLNETRSDSYSCDLRKWREIMTAYENGGHAYHATMPTDALRTARDQMMETRQRGFAETKKLQQQLGANVRRMLTKYGLNSVAAKGYEAPGVVVVYTDEPTIQNGSRFMAQGLQVAAGVPLKVDEGADFSTVRMGLFGLDKLNDIEGTLDRLEAAVVKVNKETSVEA